jgi:hypothetical protein
MELRSDPSWIRIADRAHRLNSRRAPTVEASTRHTRMFLMSKLALIAGILSIVGVLTFATFSAAADDAPAAAGACVHTEFKTELVKQACTKGGQPEAKNAMKAFMKDKKIKSCNQCHSKLAPKYELKADGLAQFQKAGGK